MPYYALIDNGTLFALFFGNAAPNEVDAGLETEREKGPHKFQHVG